MARAPHLSTTGRRMARAGRRGQLARSSSSTMQVNGRGKQFQQTQWHHRSPRMLLASPRRAVRASDLARSPASPAKHPSSGCWTQVQNLGTVNSRKSNLQ